MRLWKESLDTKKMQRRKVIILKVRSKNPKKKWQFHYETENTINKKKNAHSISQLISSKVLMTIREARSCDINGATI